MTDNVTTHYVVSIRVHQVKVTTPVKTQSYPPRSESNLDAKPRRDDTELAHYTLTEKVLATALEKGQRLLELTGE